MRLLRVLTPGAVLGLLGCTVESLPPSSARTDGGPVAPRGTVTHQARSELRLYRDAADCPSVQTVNRQFRLVRARTPQRLGFRSLVLEESYDVRHCLASESSSSEATITAWEPDSASQEPVFRISGRGVTGSADGSVYRMVAHGCCGSQNLATYYSLITGRALLTTSRTPLRFDGPEPGAVRILGFHDTYSAAMPPEVETDSTVIGVLTWADEEQSLLRLVVRADRPEHFAVDDLAVIRGGRRLTDTLFVIPSDPAARPDLVVDLRLIAPATERSVSLRIPIRAGRLDTAGARLSAGVRLDGAP